jgi:hypothetical protein
MRPHFTVEKPVKFRVLKKAQLLDFTLHFTERKAQWVQFVSEFL